MTKTTLLWARRKRRKKKRKKKTFHSTEKNDDYWSDKYCRRNFLPEKITGRGWEEEAEDFLMCVYSTQKSLIVWLWTQGDSALFSDDPRSGQWCHCGFNLSKQRKKKNKW